MRTHQELVDFYREYGQSSFAADEPAYAQVCERLAEFPELVALIAAHDPDAQQPNLIFAAVHYLLLGGIEHPLGDVYYGASDADPAPLFADLVLSHADQVNELLATQRTQTNEAGRSAVLALMLNDAAERSGKPLAWIDLGSSGGLNLNVDRFRIDYSIDGAQLSTGEPSAVTLACEVRDGDPPIRSAHALIAWRMGIDRAPIDVTDPAEARWLQACLWPSKLERHTRMAAAIEIAKAYPPEYVRAEAGEGMIQALAAAPADAAVVFTTTWVWYYLPESAQRQVVQAVHNSGRPVAWYSLEGRGVVTELGQPSKREVIDSLVGRVEFDGGAVQSADILGLSHPHGAWLKWQNN